MIELRFSLPSAGMRRNHEVNRFLLNKMKDEYSVEMGISMNHHPNVQIYREWAGKLPIKKYDLRAEVIWRQCGEGDTDNCLSSLKVLFDVMGCAPVTKAGDHRYYIGIYESDSQITRICVERERIMHKAGECVIVRLEKING